MTKEEHAQFVLEMFDQINADFERFMRGVFEKREGENANSNSKDRRTEPDT